MRIYTIKIYSIYKSGKWIFPTYCAMVSCVLLQWINISMYCIFIFTINDIFAASLRRKQLMFDEYDSFTERGFDLNEEDMIKFHIWPKGIIPYYIDDFSFDKVLSDRIRMFLNGVNDISKLHFVEMTTPPEDEKTRWVLFINRKPEDEKTRWVLFINRKGLLGCADHPFNNFNSAGVQRVVLGYHCMTSDENLASVVLSLVGVPPQHNSPDRDEFVEIMENDIIPDKLYLFDKLKDTEWLFHNVPYDFESAGHFDPYKHTLNGNITVKRKRDINYNYFINGPPPPKPKQNGFTSKDIFKIAMLYNFISRNRSTHLPECSKLFTHSSNFSESFSIDNEIIRPRKKPYKYLGLTGVEKVSEEGKSDVEVNGAKLNEDSKENNEDSDNNFEGDIVGNDEEKESERESGENIINKTNAETELNDDNHSEYDINNSKNEQSKETIKKSNPNGKSKQKVNKLNGNSKVTKKIATVYYVVARIINSTRKIPLKFKVDNSQKQKLLGLSDYETGDDSNEKYIHEKDL